MKASTQRMMGVGGIALLSSIGIHILAHHKRLAERGEWVSTQSSSPTQSSMTHDHSQQCHTHRSTSRGPTNDQMGIIAGREDDVPSMGSLQGALRLCQCAEH